MVFIFKTIDILNSFNYYISIVPKQATPMSEKINLISLFIYLIFIVEMAGVALDQEEQARKIMIINHQLWLHETQTKETE